MIPNTYVATYDFINNIIKRLGIKTYRQHVKEDFFEVELFKDSTIYRIFNVISSKEGFDDIIVEEGVTTIELNVLIREDKSIIRFVYYKKIDNVTCNEFCYG